MADLTDLEEYLKGVASAAVYPNGITQPSIAINDNGSMAPVRVYRGWPQQTALDTDLAAGTANVSVYSMHGTGVKTYQIQDATYTVVPVSLGMSISVAGDVITVSGQPNAGEYLTVILDRSNVYSQGGATAQSILQGLAFQALPTYPGTSSTATTLTIPPLTSIPMVVRQGGTATLGKVVWRQINDVMVSIWAPSETVRTAIAKAVDLAIKENIRVTLSDNSEAIIRYSRTFISDTAEKVQLYRRDLIYSCEYATVETFPGNVVTSVNTAITGIDNGSSAPAVPAIT